jgi:hypothetical protein
VAGHLPQSGEALVAEALQFPTGVAVGDDGTVYITESGLSAGGRPLTGRVLRLNPAGGYQVIASDLRAPVTGLCFHHNCLYVSEGGHPGRISRIELPSRRQVTVIDGLPSRGDYHTNTPMVLDDWLYFGQGAATNSGIVSWEPLSMPWISAEHLAHDIPGYDVELAGRANPEDVRDPERQTSAFHPYGVCAEPGTLLKAKLPCTSAVMRCRLDGSDLQLVAWGLRNPFGLGLDATGRMLVIDLGLNDRGLRPVGEAESSLFELKTGDWYGWPDFSGGEPVTAPRFHSRRPGAKAVDFLLCNHLQLGPPAEPLVRFPVHSGPTKFVLMPGAGDLLVTLFGDKRPLTGVPGPKAGRKLVRLDLGRGTMTDVAGPRFQRPIDLAYSPDRSMLYVVDFGDYEIDRQGGLISEGATGCVWCLPAAALLQSESRTFEGAS